MDAAESVRTEPWRDVARRVRVWCGSWRAWAWALLLWSIPAFLLSTHQYLELRGSGKHLSWFESFSYQGPSWLLLVPATPVLFGIVRAWPIGADHPMRVAGHIGGSLVFGVLFLVVAVPVRTAVHADPFRWGALGEVFYKSVPQFIALGAFAYWVIALVASLAETRARLCAMRDVDAERARVTNGGSSSARADEIADARAAPSADESRLTFATHVGTARVPPSDIAWISIERTGTRLHTSPGDPIDTRHTMADLEQRLDAHGFVRVHRSYIVNAARIREIIGAPSRDGAVRLDTGEKVPVSRRRRAGLATLRAAESRESKTDESR